MYLLSGYHGSRYLISAKDMIDQIAFHRNRGLIGEAFYYYETFPLNNKLLADTLLKSWYAEPAAIPGRNGQVWRPKALVVHETDSSNVVYSGNWQQKITSGFQGKILTTTSSAYSSLIYSMDVPFNAWFGVYTFIVASPTYSTQAHYVVYGDNDSSEMILDQTRGGRWNQVGTVYLIQGHRQIIKIDNQGVEANKQVMADAVMIMIDRRLSSDVVVPVSVTERNDLPMQPKHQELSDLGNYPNPFIRQMTIRWRVLHSVQTELRIYNLSGQKLLSHRIDCPFPGDYQFFGKRIQPRPASISVSWRLTIAD